MSAYCFPEMAFVPVAWALVPQASRPGRVGEARGKQLRNTRAEARPCAQRAQELIAVERPAQCKGGGPFPNVLSWEMISGLSWR
jgi:hypothetical protein